MAQASNYAWGVALLVGALCLGCGGEDDAPRGESEGTIVKFRSGEAGDVSFELGQSVEIPASFPAEVPLYPGSTAQMALAREPDGGALTLATPDSVERVFAFYKAEFKRGDWEIHAEMQLGEQRMLSASKGELFASVMVGAADDGGATIILSAGTGSP